MVRYLCGPVVPFSNVSRGWNESTAIKWAQTGQTGSTLISQLAPSVRGQSHGASWGDLGTWGDLAHAGRPSRQPEVDFIRATQERDEMERWIMDVWMSRMDGTGRGNRANTRETHGGVDAVAGWHGMVALWNDWRKPTGLNFNLSLGAGPQFPRRFRRHRFHAS